MLKVSQVVLKELAADVHDIGTLKLSASNFQGQRRVLHRSPPRQKFCSLGNVGNPFLTIRTYPNFTLRRLIQPKNKAQERRLPASAWSNKYEKRLAPDPDVNVSERIDSAVLSLEASAHRTANDIVNCFSHRLFLAFRG